MNKNFTIPIMLFFAFIAALYFGSLSAQADIESLSVWVGIGIAILFFAKGYKYSLQIALVFIWGNINLVHGFRVEPVHLGVTILTLYGLWMLPKRRDLSVKPLLMRYKKGHMVSIMLIIFVLYGVIHFLVCRIWPHIPGEFSAQNSAKAYFKAFAPMVLLWVGLFGPFRLMLGERWMSSFFKFLLITVVFNVVYLAYLYLNGFSAANSPSSSEEIGQVYIPIINAIPHHFAMRTLGPLAVLFGFAFMTDKAWWKDQTKFIKLVVIGCLLGGMAGSLMSGGRAALALAVFFVICVAFYRRHIVVIASSLAMGLLVLILANVFSAKINEKAPMFIARPLQYIMLEKGDAMATIDSSTNQRTALFSAGIEEWKSDTRIQMIGRGVYMHRISFLELKPILGEEGAFVESNLRSGTCHALIPSALIQYGAIGFCIYYIIYLLLIAYSISWMRTLKRLNYSSSLHTMCLCLLLYLLARLVIDSFSASWMNILIIIMFIMIRSRAVEEDVNKLEKQAEQ